MRVLSKSYPMNTNMTGFKWFSKKYSGSCAVDVSNLGIRRVRTLPVILKLPVL